MLRRTLAGSERIRESGRSRNSFPNLTSDCSIAMRRLRFLGKVALVLGLLALVGWFAGEQIARWQTNKRLEEQAAAIAAHREAQRATSAQASATTPLVPPSVTSSATSATTSAAADAASAAGAPAIAWTTTWPGFRGARRDGHYNAGPIRTDWKGLQPLWTQPVGRGHASVAAANGQAFTIEQRGAQEVAVAYDVLTGRELWSNGWNAMFVHTGGGPGPLATPAVQDGTVFALGATGELRALDASNGTLRWRTNILKRNHDVGVAASPLIVGNTVVTMPGNGDGTAIVAYDRASGRIAWSALDDESSYVSPVRVSLAGVDQIVAVLATRVVGLSSDRGDLLWESAWPVDGGNHAAQPVIIGDNRIFLSSGSGINGLALEITRDGERLTARELWRTNRMKNAITSSVYHDGFIYGLDLGILACLDAATGELKWKGGRYGNGQTLLASGHLVITTEEGEVVLVRATPDGHQEIGRTKAVEGRTLNHPALVDGFLLVRNGGQMAAFDLRGR
jgi:outer membrane protein assembly factor BamB